MMNNQGNKEKKEQMKKLNIAVFAVLCVVFIVVVGAIVFKSYGDELIVKYSSSSALRKSADSPKSVINKKEKQ